MTARPRIAMLVPDGVGYRNFVLGRLPEFLGAQADLVLLHGLPDVAVHSAPGLEHFAAAEAIQASSEPRLARLLRETSSLGQIVGRGPADAADVQLRMRRPRGSLPAKALGWGAHALARLAKTPNRLDRVDALHWRVVRGGGAYRRARQRIEEQLLDLMFCTHQRASAAVPWMLAAHDLGITTACFIFSWDNPPKGRMPVPADHLLVWGKQMENELRTYYPRRDPATLHRLGTPQFEPTLGGEIPTRDVFFREHGLDPARPVICYSGDDIASCPRDQDYLADLAAALRRFDEAERPQILFRRSPVDLSSRHDPVLASYPEIVAVPPRWSTDREGDWQQILPTAEDLELLAAIVHHCDAVANFASTMAFDFALLDKPGLFFAYEPTRSADDEPPSTYERNWSSAAMYRLPHQKIVHDLDPVWWARDPERMHEVIADMLEHPGKKTEARRAWIRAMLTAPLEQASERIAGRLVELAELSER